MTYDQYKLATPPEPCQCETCGDFIESFEIVEKPGHSYGYVLCQDCAAEMQQEIEDERASAFELMEN